MHKALCFTETYPFWITWNLFSERRILLDVRILDQNYGKTKRFLKELEIFFEFQA